MASSDVTLTLDAVLTVVSAAELRAAVEKMYATGMFTAEERAIALGNIAEAEAKRRLREQV